MDTKVSILMCTYNRAHYLPQAIESVIAQDFKDFELIVIDDASTDDTEKVMSAYIGFKRIRYVRNPENLGLGKNRVAALAEAKGEYVAILDSDDYWNDPLKLGKQVAFLDKHPDVAIIGTLGTIINDEGNVMGTLEYEIEDVKIRSRILAHNQFLHSSILMRRSAALEAGGYAADLAPAEDYDLILKIGSKHQLANLPDYSTSYRVHSGNTSSSKTARKVEHAKKHLMAMDASGKSYPNYTFALIKAHLRILKSKLHF